MGWFGSSFPCFICGRDSTREYHPCSHCHELMFISSKQVCRFCGLDLVGLDNPCPECRTRVFHYDAFSSMGLWLGPWREWVSQFKYGHVRGPAEWIASCLKSRWERDWAPVPIVPVPPRRKRMKTLGFDPVGDIASCLKKTDVPIRKLLIRYGDAPQKYKNREDRVSGSGLNYKIKGHVDIPEKLLLLDDVATTGGTLNHCARLLKSAGAKVVFAFAICKDEAT